MALPFNTFSNEGVPDGTIRPTYDTYFQDGFNAVPQNTENGVFGRECVKFRNGRGNQVAFSKTPIGGWSIMADNQNCNDCINTTSNFDCSTRFFHSTPKKLTDEIATNCAGGSDLDYDQFLRYNDGGVNKSCSIVTEDRFRTPIPNKFVKNTSKTKIQGGVHYPTLCQMGDYVSTVLECANQCEGISPNPEGVGDNYCHFAKNRLCGKLKADPIKKNSTGSDIINSDKDWITDKMCVDYCGGPGENTNATCLEKKNKYCRKPEDWYSDEIVNEKLNMTKADYCKTFWTENFNYDAATDACEAKLTQFDKNFNIMSKSKKGCKKLCPSDGINQVDPNFCADMKSKFCDIPNKDKEMVTFCIDEIPEKESIDWTDPVSYVVIILPILAVVLLYMVARHKFTPKNKKNNLAHVPISNALKNFQIFINSLLSYRCNLKS